MKYLFHHFTFVLCILLDLRKISYRHQIAEFYLNPIHSSVYAFVYYDMCTCKFCVHAHVYSPWCLYGNQRPALGISLHPPPLCKGVFFLCCLVLCTPGWLAPWVSWESLVGTSVLPQDWDDRTHHCLALCGSRDSHPVLVFVWQVLYPMNHFPSSVCVCLLIGKLTHLHLTELLILTFAILLLVPMSSSILPSIPSSTTFFCI